MADKLKRVDYFGVLAVIPAVVALLLAVSWGGSTYAWDSGVVISMFVLAAFFTVVFVLVEWKVAREPIIPLAMFKRHNFSVLSVVAFFIGFCMFGALNYLPLFFQVVKGDSAMDSGLRLLPMMLGVVICSMGSGNFISKTGKYRFLPLIGTTILVMGMGILSLLNESSTFGDMVGLLIPSGIGIGLTLQTLIIGGQAAVEIRDIAAATASINFFRSVGGVVGIAVCWAVINNSLTKTFNSDPRFAGQSSNVDITALNDAPEYVREFVRHAFVVAIDLLFQVTVPFAGVGFLAAANLRHIPLPTFMQHAPVVAE